MIFTSTTYVCFLAFLFGVYWFKRDRIWQNSSLLVASYVFYGWVHPWFCLLVAASTTIDFTCGLLMKRWRRKALLLSLITNLGFLAIFKYFNFFAVNVGQLLAILGFDVSLTTLNVIMPLGISFYTFQTLSYTIDVYRGTLEPCRSFLNYSCFVASFPQILSGPIERAANMLPQLSVRRKWSWERFYSVWPLMLTGYLKKLVVADNIAVYVDKIFMLEKPPLFVLFVGGVGFTIQLFADFSAYTDIARATGRLLGLELMENFRAPYLAISPSDFWRRWHISLSTWIRDYLYIPLGGSRVSTRARLAFVILTTMTLCGLWHGAAWHYVLWGTFHGVLLLSYHLIGKAGRWRPKGVLGLGAYWTIMQLFVVGGWILFRTPSLSWLGNAFIDPVWGFSGAPLLAGFAIALTIVAYSLPWLLLVVLDNLASSRYWLRVSYRWVQLVLIVLLTNPAPQQFIYSQF